MNFGFDIDGTISAAPAVFSEITHGLHFIGHKIHILTGTMDEEITKDHYEKRYEQLTKWFIYFDFLHIVNPPFHVQKKATYCQQHNIAMMFEDSNVYAQAINEAGTLCLLMPQ